MSHTATCERSDHVRTDTMGADDFLEPDARTLVSPKVAARPGGGRQRRARALLAVPEVRWSALSLLLFGVGAIGQEAGAPDGLTWIPFVGCYLAGGWEPGVAGLRALRLRTLDVDLLMIVAAVVAAVIGQVLDGALLIVIFATSGALEAVATKRTRDSVRLLLDLSPQEASRLEPDGTETVVAAAELAVGDVVVVRPGERVGVDGTVVDGASEVDQASITGEPLPVAKQPGAEVFAGTLNGTGVLRIRVDRQASDTVVARVVALVEEASATKAQTQLFIEKIEQRYAIGVVAATLALFALPLGFGEALQPTLLRAMTFMIVASPCAVVLATMPPLLSAIANAGRHGVLVKSAVVMELLGRTDLVAFDKTGTLTQGTPRLAAVCPLPGAGIETAEILRLAAAAETASEHPLGRAIAAAARERGVAVPAASRFEALPGQGVRAVVEGRQVTVRRPLFTANEGRSKAELEAAVQTLGQTAVVVAVDDEPVGVLGLADHVRPAAAHTVAALERLTGRRPVLLTGDNPTAAAALAAAVGISDVRAGLLPHDKVAAVHQLQDDGTALTVVGDGINDAPALAAAHLGLAMGVAGTDLTLETADAVLVRDELTAVPAVISLSKKAKRITTQNLCFAAAVICGLVAIDLAGHLPLPLGVAGHEGSTVIVGINGLRLLSGRSWPGPT